ncbi:MAG: GAF domain-containing protein, partial [Clostridiales bacterium]|nr:GAF domain-containing protein [Clostridiales bacterium]
MKSTKNKIVELHKVLEITKLLNSSNNVDYIIEHLMQATLQILERADIGVIFLYDEDLNVLRLKASIGFGDIEMELDPGESITGTAFNMKKTLHLKNHQEMMILMNKMTKSKFHLLDKKIPFPMNAFQSSISCPLIHKEKCIGVFVIDNFIGKDALNEDDIYLAELISQHATIAIINANNHKIETENQKKLQNYSLLIEKEKNRYKYSTYLHDKFTEMVLNGNNISDILKEVSQMLKKDIFTIDLFN